MNLTGVFIGLFTFAIIGVFHPVVIKGEYYFGTRCWWVFLLSGVAGIVAALMVENPVVSPCLGVFGCS
jgi:hypothetical protein